MLVGASDNRVHAACRRCKEPASASKAQLRPYPFGEAADCVVCLGGATSHHLEAVQHLRKDIEPNFDTRSPGSLGKHSAVIDKGLVASGLQVDRRESSKIRIERACMWITPVTVANQIRQIGRAHV